MRDELGTFFTDEQFSDLFPDSSLRRRGGWRW
jgi:hypothetical protein